MKTKTLLMAAVVAAILIGTSCSSNKSKSVDVDQLFSTYMTLDDIPSFAQKGSVDSVINLVETAFKSKDYKGVTNIIASNQSEFDEADFDLIYIYQGVSYAKTGKYDKAHEVLANNEIYDNSIYGQMANWYLAMSMMKGQNVSEAKKLFTKFANDPTNYKQAEAKEILKKMK